MRHLDFLASTRTLLVLASFAAAPSSAIVSFRNEFPATHFVPCEGYHRDCYPGFESCHGRRFCFLNSWILLAVALFGMLSLLAVLLVFYFLLFRQGRWMVSAIVTLTIASFLLALAVLITVAFHQPQEQLQPMSMTKAEGNPEEHLDQKT